MADQPTYEIILIPKLTANHPNITKLAEKFRVFRLNALQVSPTAFASTYEIESQHSLDRSVQRLITPKAAQYVALRTTGSERAVPDEDALETLGRLLRYEWVGFIVLLGPEEGDELSIPSANIDPFGPMTAQATSGISNQKRDAHYHLNGMFVDPSARGARLGRNLIDVAIQRAVAEAKTAGKPLHLTLSVFEDNVAASHLYKSAGFEVVRETDSRSRPGFRALHMQLRDAAGGVNDSPAFGDTA